VKLLESASVEPQIQVYRGSITERGMSCDNAFQRISLWLDTSSQITTVLDDFQRGRRHAESSLVARGRGNSRGRLNLRYVVRLIVIQPAITGFVNSFGFELSRRVAATI
jgi:hypothetical protein